MKAKLQIFASMAGKSELLIQIGLHDRINLAYALDEATKNHPWWQEWREMGVDQDQRPYELDGLEVPEADFGPPAFSAQGQGLELMGTLFLRMNRGLAYSAVLINKDGEDCFPVRFRGKWLLLTAKEHQEAHDEHRIEGIDLKDRGE